MNSISFAQQPSYPSSQPDAGYQQDPPGRVARIAVIQGEVSLEPAGSDTFAQAELNYPLTIGDRVYSDLKALAELETAGLAVRLSNGADLTLTSLTDQVAQFGLAQGSIRVSTRNMTAPDGSASVIEIDTPNGTIVVQAAGDIRVDSYPQNNSTVVTVTSGQVEVTGANLDQVLGPRESVHLTGVNPVSARFVGLLPPDALDQFDQYREGEYQNTVASEGQYVSPDMIGAEDLAQYGSWSDDQSYGSVWFPTSVAVGWTPYHNGRWCYIAPWGWTWIESEPWGFAPFHYGRWNRFGNRWGWIPGPPPRVFGRPVRPVYSPALVAFVGGVGVTAWFPLGPGEAFVPWYRTSAVYVNRVNVTNIYSRDERQVRANYGNRTVNVYVDNRVYTNRGQGLTALNQTDFSAGRHVERSQPIRLDPNSQRQLSQAPVTIRPTAGPVAPTGFAPARVAPASVARPQLPTRAEFDRSRGPDPARNNPGRNDPARTAPGSSSAVPSTPAPATPTRVDPSQTPPRPVRTPVAPAVATPETPQPRTYQPPAAPAGTRPVQPATPAAPAVVTPAPAEPRQPEQRQFERQLPEQRQPEQENRRQEYTPRALEVTPPHQPTPQQPTVQQPTPRQPEAPPPAARPQTPPAAAAPKPQPAAPRPAEPKKDTKEPMPK
jgi:hypothetical protein